MRLCKILRVSKNFFPPLSYLKNELLHSKIQFPPQRVVMFWTPASLTSHSVVKRNPVCRRKASVLSFDPTETKLGANNVGNFMEIHKMFKILQFKTRRSSKEALKNMWTSGEHRQTKWAFYTNFTSITVFPYISEKAEIFLLKVHLKTLLKRRRRFKSTLHKCSFERNQ